MHTLRVVYAMLLPALYELVLHLGRLLREDVGSLFKLAANQLLIHDSLRWVPHYIKLVEQHNEHSFVPREEKRAEDLDWGDEEPTPEEARSMMHQLKSVLSEEEEIDWEEKVKNLVPGNDTIN